MIPQTFLDGRVQLWGGDCLEVLDNLPENSVDSCVVDPPYHLTSIVKRFGAAGSVPAQYGKDGAFARQSRGFMSSVWDGGDIAFRPETWAKVLRVLKPGAYIVAFASTRGVWRMGVAIEDAGFINHPMLAWCFATGFPKATRIKAEGYDGWRYGGQALKPAIEPIYMGQKPFEKGLSGTENILKWGTGALNIDGCRVGISDDDRQAMTGRSGGNAVEARLFEGGIKTRPIGEVWEPSSGRWPANLIHDGSEEVLEAFPETGPSPSTVTRGPSTSGHGSSNRSGELQTYPCHGDSGSAARFFYSSKADAEDRLGSKHPTVKPLDLMQYLVRLITPPGGTCLDCFAGTGTTGEAAWREGFSAILIEREPEYQADIARRMDLAVKPAKRSAVAKTKGKLMGAEGTPLFGDAA
jgi:site-specific DNA-methyltransferase (adenine-specific)